MSFVLNAVREGGSAMFLLIAVFLILLPVAALRLGLARRAPAPGLGVASIGLVVAMGLVAAFHGLGLTVEAALHVDAQVRPELVAAGLRESLIPVWTGLVLGAVLAPVHAIAGAMGQAAGRSRLGMASLVTGGGVGLLALVSGGLLILTVGQLRQLGPSMEPQALLALAAQVSLWRSIGMACGAGAVLLSLPALLVSVGAAVTALTQRQARLPRGG